MASERKKYAIVSDETMKAEGEGSGNLTEYRVRVVERWIVQYEEANESEMREMRKEVADLKTSVTWWTGAAAASAAIGTFVLTIGVVFLGWALGFIKLGAATGVVWNQLF